MKPLLTLLIAFVSVPLSAATVFNVDYDSSGLPQVSGPGGSLPPPLGLPVVTQLSVNAPNGTHLLGGGGPGDTLWINQYTSGDYFTFSVLAQDSVDRIALTGVWFGTVSGPTGPTSFNVELWTDGTFQSGAATGLGQGVNLFFPTDMVSDSSVAEFRISGFGGTDDVGPQNSETFGLDFISFSFEVVPEPSSLLLSVICVFSLIGVRRR